MSDNSFMSTLRRVQDCCALLHNSIGKWNQLTEESLDLLTDIINCKYVNTTEKEEIKRREKQHSALTKIIDEMVCSLHNYMMN